MNIPYQELYHQQMNWFGKMVLQEIPMTHSKKALKHLFDTKDEYSEKHIHSDYYENLLTDLTKFNQENKQELTVKEHRLSVTTYNNITPYNSNKVLGSTIHKDGFNHLGILVYDTNCQSVDAELNVTDNNCSTRLIYEVHSTWYETYLPTGLDRLYVIDENYFYHSSPFMKHIHHPHPIKRLILQVNLGNKLEYKQFNHTEINNWNAIYKENIRLHEKPIKDAIYLASILEREKELALEKRALEKRALEKRELEKRELEKSLAYEDELSVLELEGKRRKSKGRKSKGRKSKDRKSKGRKSKGRK